MLFLHCSYQEKAGGRGIRDGGRDGGRDGDRDGGRGGVAPLTSPVGSPAERPKLALKPRSGDSPAAAADGASPAKANPFGGAKANDASKARMHPSNLGTICACVWLPGKLKLKLTGIAVHRFSFKQYAVLR